MKKQEDWKTAEDIVKNLTGGKKTPGSGNKNIKGDVRIKMSLGIVEVKQTSKDYIDLQNKWFTSLEKFASTSEIVLVVFFQLRGYPYYFYGKSSTPETWSSKRVKEDSLPTEIHTKSGKWILEDLSSLRAFKKT